MATSKVTLYVGRWNEIEYAYALTLGGAIASIKEHYAYGDPSENEYAVGQEWASENNSWGWNIVKKEIDPLETKAEVRAGSPGETGHVTWSCPVCGKSRSDDWLPDDELPILLMCGCDEKSKFLLGVHLVK